MLEIGERIDDGYRGMARELLEGPVGEDAGGDASTQRERLRAMSGTDSRLPMPISWAER